jgi:hypothetical protein
MAIGMFLVLSVIVFGSILYTCFSCVDNEIVSVDTDAGFAREGMRVGEYLATQDELAPIQEAIDPADGYWKGIDRGDMVLLPD